MPSRTRRNRRRSRAEGARGTRRGSSGTCRTVLPCRTVGSSRHARATILTRRTRSSSRHASKAELARCASNTRIRNDARHGRRIRATSTFCADRGTGPCHVGSSRTCKANLAVYNACVVSSRTWLTASTVSDENQTRPACGTIDPRVSSVGPTTTTAASSIG